MALLVYSLNAGDYLLFDSWALLNNPSLSQLQVEPTIADHWRAAILSTETGPLKRPLAMLSFALEFAATDTIPVQLMRLINIVLHCSIALVIYLITVQLAQHLLATRLKREQGYFSLLVAGLWLLHPLHVSTVLYIVQRMTQLSALFVLLGIYSYLKMRTTWLTKSPTSEQKSGMVVAVLLFTLLAALSKENGLLLPWYVVLLECVVFRWQVGGAVSQFSKYSCAVLVMLPVVFLLLLWGTGYFESSYSLRDFSLSERLLTQGRILWHYTGWIVLPDISAMGFYHDDLALSKGWLQPLTTLVAALSWAGVCVAGYLCRKKLPLISLGAGWFLLGHSMESTIFPLELAFEHRNYLPSIGPLLIVALAIVNLGKLRTRMRLDYIAGAGAVLCLLLMLIIRSSYWKNEVDLSAYQWVNHPHSPRSAYYFANTHLKIAEGATNKGDFNREITLARSAYEKLYQLDPQELVSPVTLFYIDTRFLDGGQADQWLSAVEKRVAKPVLAASDNNALGLLGRIAEAGFSSSYRKKIVGIYEKVSQYHPRNIQAQYHWAKMSVDYLGKRKQGIALMEKVAANAPRWPTPRYQLALWYSEDEGNYKIYDQLQKIMTHDRWLLEIGKLNTLFSEGKIQVGG